jgi:hypothetical protein
MKGISNKLLVLQLISSGEVTQLGIIKDLKILLAKNCGRDISNEQVWNFLIDLLSHEELKFFLGQKMFALSQEEITISDAIVLLVCYCYDRLQKGFMDEFDLESVD